jgi:hypothetical protein
MRFRASKKLIIASGSLNQGQRPGAEEQTLGFSKSICFFFCPNLTPIKELHKN